MNQRAIIGEIIEAILCFDDARLREFIKGAFGKGIDVTTLINNGLTAGLVKLGERFESGEAFLPELIKGATMVQENMKFLEPHIKKDGLQTKAKLLIGTVYGDVHDVGKNIVSIVFSARGFDVIDLGINVPAETFVEKVKQEQPDLLGLSALLTTTMNNQRTVIESVTEAGLRDKVKIIVGGAPISEAWAKEIDADAYAEDVFSGLKKAEQLLNLRND